MNKKGQLTIFIILAIIIVLGIIGYFLLSSTFTPSKIPTTFEPVYNAFLQCIQDKTATGIDILESQGGYIELPAFEAGSGYSPFGSQLDFVGNPIPYWYYVSGNNIAKEQVPSRSFMEEELANYIKKNMRDCYYGNYYEQGFEINQGDPDVEVTIRKESVDVEVQMNLGITKSEESVYLKSFNKEINSQLGALYDAAIEVYNHEQSDLFLEEYALDVLHLYAPVDGAEITCSPMVWNGNEVFTNLRNALEANTNALKTQRGEYTLNDDIDKYFVVDFDAGKNVRFLSSANWSMAFEVAPAEGGILIANPAGPQQALGIIGLCYVNYHFVYDVKYPVLIQVYEGDETFQFPMAVIIDNNQPRESLKTSAVEYEDEQFCEYANTRFEIKTYDLQSNPVEADIFYECFSEKCKIGKTQGGSLTTGFPQCVNGKIIATAQGYADKEQTQTIVEEGTTNIYMNKLHEVNVDLKVDSKSTNSYALITFVSNSLSKTIVYPETKTINLSEGQYEVSVYIYRNSTLNLQGYSKEQCVEVPQEGLGALFGLTKEKCFDFDIPNSVVSNALVGGGQQEHYILENTLVNSKNIEIDTESLKTPKTIEELQQNYIDFENKGLNIKLK